ncbi:hypothetical protein [Paucisalibacillus globulus]|uniref:hypothetical protein n=1 Tax=Paucisalibacillus globulus TaxID=351095 RepID=UPI00041304AA|nr:hypothetical protein [Paucisalibacillus globulus]
MKPKMKVEQGYTLLLAVLIGVLFSIMIVSLITITMSGVSKNDVREDNQQATALSQKGLDHIANYISTDLKEKIGDGIPQDDFIVVLDELLDSLSCDNEPILHNINSVTGNYDVCVNKHHKDINEAGQEVPTRQKVEFKSLGIVDGTEKEMVSTMIIGAQAVPDALNYAIGSHCMDNCDDIPGEGNLFLHGGIEVKGDLKVDGNIITTNQGIARQGRVDQDKDDWNDYWIGSIRPAIYSDSESSNGKAKVVLGKEIYTFTGNKDYSDHIKLLNFNSSGYSNATNNLSNAFSVAPEIVNREPIRDQINVKSKIEASNDWVNDVDVRKIQQSTFTNTNYSNSKVYAYTGSITNGSCVKWKTEYEEQFVWIGPWPWNWGWKTYEVEVCAEYEQIINESNGTINLRGNNSFKRFATRENRDVKISGDNKLNVSEIMYVGGDLTIGNETSSYNPNDYDDIELQGREIYVNGDLTIKGANASVDVIMYVKGKVSIQNTVINGKSLQNGDTGSLIIFADKAIDISNNSVNQDTPSRIHGYFYSNDVFEMYGVGSNIEITGGISARRIVLNAVRGKVKNPTRGWDRYYYCESGYSLVNDSCYAQSQNLNLNSRLSVIYNPGIVGRFSELTFSEPIIYNVEPPQLIDRDNNS